jgi:hypothetical protein
MLLILSRNNYANQEHVYIYTLEADFFSKLPKNSKSFAKQLEGYF